MASVFQELTLTWKGEEYKVKPTMALLNKVEQDVSLATLAYRSSKGDLPLSHLATALAAFLREAGCKVSPEEVYGELAQAEPEEIHAAVGAVIQAAFPQMGKPEAPAKPKQKARKKAGKTSSGGTSTT